MELAYSHWYLSQMAALGTKKSKTEIAVVAVIATAAFVCHAAHMRLLDGLQVDDDYQYHNKRFIPQPLLTKAFSLGFDRVIADMYWLIFIQYYGDPKCKEENFRYAPDYLQVVVNMDPHFIRPYWFASFVLASDLGQEERADDILASGIKSNPQDWSIPYIAGFNQYLYANNEKKAAYYYRLAANIPGAPSWLNDQARILELDIPSYLKKVRTWLRILKEGDAMIKQKALQNLTVLWSKMYWAAPTELMKKNIKGKLEQYGLPLLPRDKVPDKSLILKEVE